MLALSLPLRYAAGTSLVVISITSAAALLARTGSGSNPDWGPVLILTVVSVAAAMAGTRIADRIEASRLSAAFVLLVLGVATYTAVRAVSALF